MRAIFVNHCHPDCPHVCGTRAREFANALARQGHQIVLLTETLRRDDLALDPNGLEAALAAHDWAQPFRLACRPRPSPALEALRAGRLPGPVRKLIVLYQYLVRGGMFTDWRAGSRPYWEILARSFRPHVTWGIFGNTDAWAIAQGIARFAGCPWVRDIKDQWTRFIPALVRQALAGRYADAAGTTALSQVNATNAAPWFSHPAAVVYSGFSIPSISPVYEPDPEAPFTMLIIGAVYDTRQLTKVVDGIMQFLDTGARGPVQIIYVGTDVAPISAALRSLEGRIIVMIRGQLPFPDYWSLITRSNLNIYIRTPETGWWHHKIVELLAAGCPILCSPGEIDEARALASTTGGQLYGGADASTIAAAIADAWSTRKDRKRLGDPARFADLTWDSQAKRLAAALTAASLR